MVKNPAANAEDRRDAGSIPGSGRSPGGGHGNPLQYFCLDNPMDRGACDLIPNKYSASFINALSLEKSPGLSELK